MNLHNLSRRGFESAEELHDMVAQLNLIEQAEAFKTWDDRAGSKADLQALLPVSHAAQLQAEFNSLLSEIPSFEEFYRKCAEAEDAATFSKGVSAWRQHAVGRHTRRKFNEFSETIDEKTDAGMTELEAFASVVLSAISRIIAVEYVDNEIETFLKLEAMRAQAATKPKKRPRRKK